MASGLQKRFLTIINLIIFMFLNTSPTEGVRRFQQTLQGVRSTEELRTPGLKFLQRKLT